MTALSQKKIIYIYRYRKAARATRPT